MPTSSPKQRELPVGTISTFAAARVSGLHWRTLLRWMERKTLHPRLYIGTAGEKGSAYAWSLPDLVAARTILELRAAGLSAQKVRRAAKLVESFGRSLSSVKLWSDGRDAFEILADKRLVSVLAKPGQHVLFPLSVWARDVEKRFVLELRKRERVA